MTRRTLLQWLDHQQSIHPRSVELGLDRVGAVWQRMGAPRPAPVVITVGGTNGKGSTVAFLEAMLTADGKRVGSYTSPHLLRYNERVRVMGEEAGDAALVDAFERIDAARGATATDAIALTYFEFGTLAALWIFAQSKLDVAVLEVGLGGRLDAVNIIDADAAVVTTIDLDHQDWLGNDRDSIGREKAGIFRAARPAVIGTRAPPAGLLVEARRIGAEVIRVGIEYDFSSHAAGWRWQYGKVAVDLPAPALLAPCQIDNAAAAIAALYTLRDRLGWNPAALVAAVGSARLPARLQRLHKPGAADLIVDVAHNPQAAGVLGEWLRQNPVRGRTLAVFGALADKDVAGIVAPLMAHIGQWFLGGLDADTPRGLPVQALRARMRAAAPGAGIEVHTGIAAALYAAAAQADVRDRVLAFGSFFVAATALQWARCNGWIEAEPAHPVSKV
ncbi:MAG: bifunctional tetrahydrofolate synthase/dihydrofolate synthase [Rudaea sp.]|nr:bifunctional tetrahydrofolate synthase/dihydrofolate synthase [Rudaea sp.]